MTDTMIRSTATAPTCNARTGVTAGDYGFTPLWCNTAIGLRSFTDRQGETRRYCAAPGHEEAVLGRYGRAPEPEDDCGHEAVTDIEPVHGILYGICAGCGLTVSATGDEYEDGTPSWEPTDNQPSVYATEWHGHRVEAEVV